MSGRDPLAEAVDAAVGWQAVNIEVVGAERRVFLHAGHVFGSRSVEGDDLASVAWTAADAVRAWLAAAAPFRPFHELRLRLGVEQPDGFEPDRLTFEWARGPRPRLESCPPDAFADGSFDLADAGADYPHAKLPALQRATRALMGLKPDVRRLAIRIQTRLLDPATPDRP